MQGFVFDIGGVALPDGFRKLWASFLGAGIGGILLPVESEGGLAAPGIVSSVEAVESTRVLSPYMPMNSARLLQRVTRLSSPSEVLLAVLRPCEAMATLELMKLNQVSRENLVIAAIDCLGTYPYTLYRDFLDKGGDTEVPFPDKNSIREACRVCLNPVAPWADIRLGFIGMEGGIAVEALTDEGKRFLEHVGFEVSKVSLGGREEAISSIVSERGRERSTLFEELSSFKGNDAILKALSPCIKCLNCMEMCPICYCRECFFRSQAFEMEADRFLELSASRGAVRLPTDILLFHLTRMVHMSFSCVACGMCQESCPKDVPVFRMFLLASSEVQDMFDYKPGLSPEDPIPITVFREDEFKEVEDRKL